MWPSVVSIHWSKNRNAFVSRHIHKIWTTCEIIQIYIKEEIKINYRYNLFGTNYNICEQNCASFKILNSL